MEPNQQFGKLTTIRPLAGGKFWLCKCSCGGQTKASKWHLERGLRRSCGCRTQEVPLTLTCKVCQVEKPLEQFYRRPSGKVSQVCCKDCVRERMRLYGVLQNRELKLEGLRRYSDGKPKCVCCNEDRVEFLELDHLNGDGNEHRKEIKTWGIYRWLAKHNYPPLALRVLCSNCNQAYASYGYCPHHEPDKSLFSLAAIAETKQKLARWRYGSQD